MNDRFTDRLSEYLDGELAADEAREVEEHLRSCAGCREVLADLRRVVDRAAGLRDREPAADLWAGIADRIRAEPPEVRVVSLFDAKRARRRISFSVPQLLAAGLVLALASAGSVWMTLRGGQPGAAGPVAVAPVEVVREAPAVPVAEGAAAEEPLENVAESVEPEADAGVERAGPAPPSGRAAPRRGTRATVPGAEPSSRFVAYEDPAYDAAVADLQDVLEQGRDRLDPRTVQVLEESLSTIDAAIEDARRALEADPANARLNTYLAGTRQRKLDLLREASQIVTAVT
ncbi:MAG TPA: anti-sigma factor [Longimicrobiaceae bacterium]|nr:anti-sigma factor [Longimicrobiaceae bacterium]